MLLGQLLRLSAYSKQELRLAERIKALHTILDYFGNAKTLMSPNASRHVRYLELHFGENGRINAAKILAFGLDMNRLIRLTHEERTYHIFYQFIAGATTAERDIFNIEDPSDYNLLASSGCYCLPAGPFIVETCNHRLAPSSKDAPPPTQVVFFDQPGFQTRGPAGTTSISLSGNRPLISAYGQNGFDEFCINFSAELLQSYYIRQPFETAGYNGQITGDGVFLPEISTMDNGSCVELLRGAVISERAQRKPGGLLGVLNKACSSFKSGKDSESGNGDFAQELSSRDSVHTSFAGTSDSRRSFGINHYSNSCSYDISQFVEKNADLLDSAFVLLLRNSSEAFVSKLFSGPSLAAERHSKDDGIIVQAQVSSRPLRQLTPIYSGQLSFVTRGRASSSGPEQDLLYHYANELQPVRGLFLFGSHKIMVNPLYPTQRFQRSNSFDKRRVKSQIRSLLLPDVIARRSIEYVVEFEQESFCDRFVPTMRGSDQERIIQCARANGWKEGIDYSCGHRSIWLSYDAWKMVEDPLRAQEKEMMLGSREGEEEEDLAPDDNTDFTPAPAGSTYFRESVENLLLTRTGTDGTMYKDPNARYGSGGLRGPAYGSKSLLPPDDPAA